MTRLLHKWMLVTTVFCVAGCNPEQQMMYAGSMKSLVSEAGLSKVV